MKSGTDIAINFPGLFLVHHNKPGQSVKQHAHDEHHLIIPLRGEVRVICEEKTLSIGPGRMIYIPAKLAHEFIATNTKEGERLLCMIDSKLWKKAGASDISFGAYPAHQLTKELLFYLLLNPKTKNANTLLKLLVSTLSENLEGGHLLGAGESLQHLFSKAKDLRVQKSIRYLENHFSKSFKMDELAKTSGMSVRNLTRLFVEELGIGPKEALIRVRLNEAMRLLKEKNLSVTEICFEVGYQSLSRFIQAFRDAFGKLPSEI